MHEYKKRHLPIIFSYDILELILFCEIFIKFRENI